MHFKRHIAFSRIFAEREPKRREGPKRERGALNVLRKSDPILTENRSNTHPVVSKKKKRYFDFEFLRI